MLASVLSAIGQYLHLPLFACSSAFGGFQYDSEVGARAATVRLDATALVDLNSATATAAVYTNGGCWYRGGHDGMIQSRAVLIESAAHAG